LDRSRKESVDGIEARRIQISVGDGQLGGETIRSGKREGKYCF